MFLLICSISLLIIALFLSHIEKRGGRTFLTPTFLLGVPFGVMLIFTELMNTMFPTYSTDISILVPTYTFIYLMLFYYVGKLERTFFKGFNNADFRVQELNNTYIYNLIAVLCISYIGFYFIKTFGLNVKSLISVKSTVSQAHSVGHFINILTALLLLIFTNDIVIYKLRRYFNWFKFLIHIVWVLFLAVATAKYMLMMYVASLIISYSIVFPKKVKLITIVKGLTLAFVFPVLFFLVYAIRFISIGYSISNLPVNFIMGHLQYYIVGSYYAFSQVIDFNLTGTTGWAIVFAPLINVYNLISGGTGTFVDPSSNFISIGNGEPTNVYTMFGAFQYETGVFGAIFLVIVISVIVFLAYYKAMQKFTVARITLYSYLGSSLVISFFNAFYGSLNVWEIIIVIGCISGIERYKFVFKKGNTK